jgi:hypothetical protein
VALLAHARRRFVAPARARRRLSPGICLVAGALNVFVPATHFTLAWMHSIEKIRWEEDYAVRGAALHLVEARIRGTGAGMEPPEGARLDAHGVWHYHSQVSEVPLLSLARSTYTRDYELCIGGQCRALSEYVPISAGTTTLEPCSR